MNEFQMKAAWAAGIVDADGCIRIRRAKRKGEKVYFSLYIAVGQSGETLPPVLAELHRWFDGAIEGPKITGGARLPMWQWRVACATAAAFLKAIRPYLVGKADQADVALEYRATGMGRGKGAIAETYYHRLRAMKNYTQSKEAVS